ncbi:hypothetical protein NEOKW01_1084 [Nematocida sp. AWRm80]|nr:hypothetical protein NEOKW01_1084 [Nematocida sp. AWRm80]
MGEQPEMEREEKTSKQLFMERVTALLANPNEANLGGVKVQVKKMLKQKEKGSSRLIILAMAKVFFNLLPSYNIRVVGYKYNVKQKASNTYEYLLLQEWQAYLKLVTQSKTNESYEAAAILLPQTILFNKSGKLIGKVIKGTGVKGKVGEKCIKVLKKLFKCDTGNRIVRILEVFDQLPLEKIPRAAIRALILVNDKVLKQPEQQIKLRPEEMRKLSVEEKAVKKEAQLHFYPEEMKAWKGINERLLRIYMKILTTKSIEKYYYALLQLQRLRIPGNLHEGIYTVISHITTSLKTDPTPLRTAIMCLGYSTLHALFGEKLEFSMQIEEIENIPLDRLVQMNKTKIAMVYTAIERIGKKQGSSQLIKLLLKRGMYRIDPALPAVIKHLMPKEGPRGIETNSVDGFWEYALIRPKTNKETRSETRSMH